MMYQVMYHTINAGIRPRYNSCRNFGGAWYSEKDDPDDYEDDEDETEDEDEDE